MTLGTTCGFCLRDTAWREAVSQHVLIVQVIPLSGQRRKHSLITGLRQSGAGRVRVGVVSDCEQRLTNGHNESQSRYDSLSSPERGILQLCSGYRGHDGQIAAISTKEAWSRSPLTQHA